MRQVLHSHWRETSPSFVLDPAANLQLFFMRKRGDAPVANNTPHGYGYSVHCVSCEIAVSTSADGRAWSRPRVALPLPEDGADRAGVARGLVSSVGYFARAGATVAATADREQIHLFMAKFINSSAGLGGGALGVLHTRGDWDAASHRYAFTPPHQVLRDDDNGSPVNALVLPSGRVLFAHAASRGDRKMVILSRFVCCPSR